MYSLIGKITNAGTNHVQMGKMFFKAPHDYVLWTLSIVGTWNWTRCFMIHMVISIIWRFDYDNDLSGPEQILLLRGFHDLGSCYERLDHMQ